MTWHAWVGWRCYFNRLRTQLHRKEIQCRPHAKLLWSQESKSPWQNDMRPMYVLRYNYKRCSGRSRLQCMGALKYCSRSLSCFRYKFHSAFSLELMDIWLFGFISYLVWSEVLKGYFDETDIFVINISIFENDLCMEGQH